MSEYQYYGSQAIDRPLSGDDMRWLRGLSTRAQITTTSFVNVYNWGDWRAFLDNHLKDIVVIDFFTVSTATFPQDAIREIGASWHQYK